MPRRTRGQIQPDGKTSIIIEDKLLPGGALACDECGEPATVFRKPIPLMEIVFRDLRFKFCSTHGALTQEMRSYMDITENEYRQLEEWPLLD